MKLNLGCGRHPREGWVNIDRSDIPEVDRRMDLFRYPWNIPDDSVEEVYCSHIIEHIPHEPKFSLEGIPVGSLSAPIHVSEDSWSLKRWEELAQFDGFFCFFAEIWRVSKPNTIVEIVCPYGMTFGALQDPTHTRYIVPQSFAYLTSEIQNSPDFEYNVPCLYEIIGVRFDLPSNYEGKEELFAHDKDYFWNITRNMYVQLKVIK